MNTKPSPLSLAYFRFLQLRRSFTAHDGIPLSANERALLESIVLAWHEGLPMPIRQAITLKELGSPATLHKRLSKLRAAGLLEVMAASNDRRTKLLIPTEKAFQYFEQLGQAMSLQALSSTPSLN